MLQIGNRMTLQQQVLLAHNHSLPLVLVLLNHIRSRRVVLTTIHELAGDIRSLRPLQLRNHKILHLVPRLDIRNLHLAAIDQLALLHSLRCTSLQSYRVALWQPF